MTYIVERLAGLRRHLDHKDLARLPGLRNILVHEYVGLDYGLVIEALDNLGPAEDFLRSALARVGG
jgi:uncharacterized protein YutE (UPF0331/DUF86 family)